MKFRDLPTSLSQQVILNIVKVTKWILVQP